MPRYCLCLCCQPACRNKQCLQRIHTLRLALSSALFGSWQYYFYPLEEEMTKAGFKHVTNSELDPRHRIVIGHLA